MGGRIPGPICQVRNWYDVDDGTMARQMSPLPGSLNWIGKRPGVAGGVEEPLHLTGDILLKIVPKVGVQADSVASNLNLACKDAGISTRIGQAMFIAQLAHESAGFTRLQEMGGKTRYTFAKYAEKDADDIDPDIREGTAAMAPGVEGLLQHFAAPGVSHQEKHHHPAISLRHRHPGRQHRQAQVNKHV